MVVVVRGARAGEQLFFAAAAERCGFCTRGKAALNNGWRPLSLMKQAQNCAPDLDEHQL